MRFIRNALIVGGLHFCFLFLMPGNAYSQVYPPPPYFFVEVKDTAGQKVTDATVAVTSQTGKPMVTAKTNEKGISKADLGVRSFDHPYGISTFDHHYNVTVSKPGFLNSENVLFLSPCCMLLGSTLTMGILTENGVLRKNYNYSPTEVVLTKIPVTAEERQIVEIEDRKYQFFLAIKRGEKDAVDKFLRAGISVNTVDSDNIPAIVWAVFSGNGEIIKSLLAAKADIRNTKSIGNQSLLIYLTEGIPRNENGAKDRKVAKNDEIVLSLIKAGAAIDIKSPQGAPVLNTAVRMAYRSLSPGTINLLISSGADVKALDQYGETALMAATKTRSPEIIRILAKAGSPIDTKDSYGQTPLMVTVRDANGAEYVKLFLELGADPRLKNRYGETALDIARSGRVGQEVINLLEQASRRP